MTVTYHRVQPKEQTKIKCPRCEKIWYAKRFYAGRGILREYCKACKQETKHTVAFHDLVHSIAR